MILNPSQQYLGIQPEPGYPKTPAIVMIDSRDRPGLIYGTGSNEFVVELTQGFNRVSQVDLVSLEMPNTIYNVDYWNNTLVYTTNAITYSVTVPPGAYTAGGFLTALATLMNTASGSTFTISTSGTNFLVTFTNSVPFVLNFSNISNTMGYILGFPIGVDTTSGTSVTGTSAMNMSLPSYLYIYIQQINSNGTTTKTLMPSFPTFIIPITSNTAADITYYEYLQGPYKLSQQQIGFTGLGIALRVPIVSYAGPNLVSQVVLADNSNVDWQMVLRIHSC